VGVARYRHHFLRLRLRRMVTNSSSCLINKDLINKELRHTAIFDHGRPLVILMELAIRTAGDNFRSP
jgi:hypothetical protein